MENNEFEKDRVKNRTRYYFHDIIKLKLEDFDLDNILIDKKSRHQIFIYDISYKTLIGPKPLWVKVIKIDGFIRIFDGNKNSKLFVSEICDAIYNRIRYLLNLKKSITYIFSHNFSKMKFDSYDLLPIGKRFTLHNVIIHINQFLMKIKIAATIRHF